MHRAKKFSSANPQVHDLLPLLVFEKPLYMHIAWSNYGLDVLNIAQTYLFVTSDSLDEILSDTMGSCKSKILNEF